ncbi:MAG TPA: DUF5107 domain-containing protein [Phycisphaerae bacterium]|nr:DUF5107 domain-containing protein [Phycisphaerae bacterium]
MKQVRLTRRMIDMENHTQDPLNPHPVFPQWSPWSVYPYQFWGSMTKRIVRQKYQMVSIENEYLRLTVAPDIGGRIWDVYDKVNKRHLANFNSGVRTYNAGFGMNYTTGGIECNYPLAHSPTTSRKREVSTARYDDGSAAIIISELDLIWRTRWSMTCRLYPNRTYVEQHVRIYNRTPHDSRYMYWNNCGFILNDNRQFIFPESAGAMHGAEVKTFSYPTWRHRDLSFFKQVPTMLGLYMLDSDEPYFGYYDHDAQFGFVHYSDLADLPGKKYWTWGNVPDRMEVSRKTVHSRNEVFGEMQSGRIMIQEHQDRMPPETECEWYERWYPVRETGTFNGAGPGAVMRVELLDVSGGRSRLRIVANGNAFFPDAAVLVTSDGAPSVKHKMPLNPLEAVKKTVTLRGKAGPDAHTTVSLLDANGERLGVARLRRPSSRDSWREVIEVKDDVQPVGAEDIFMLAETKARDWGNYDLVSLYEKALRQDSGFSPARRELGKLAIWGGLYDKAVEHFKVALERDSDSLESRYFLGVALMHAGKTAEARKAFELANRYDWEARSLVRLAELRMREKNWHHALKHLDRLGSAYPRLTRPRCLRAICLRKIGRNAAAAAEIAAGLKMDGQDPFLRMTAMFTKTGSTDVKKLSSRAVKSLIDQVRGYEPPLLEAAFDCLSVGLLEETAAVLKIIPNPGPLGTFVLAYVNDRLNRQGEAMRLLKRACGLDVVGHQPWRLEMIPILEWARDRLPKNPRAVFYLGNLMMARRRTEEGAQLWRKAKQMGEKHYLLLANLGFYETHVAGNPKHAVAHFRKAVRTEQADLYVKHELFSALVAAGKRAEGVRYLESEKKAVRSSPLLAHDLLCVYLDRDDYKRFDALCGKVDFSANFQIAGPHDLWLRRQFQEAVQLAQKGRLKRALEMLRDMKPAPAHLGVVNLKDLEDDRRYYHMGCIHEQMGDMDKARSCWEKTLTFEHGMYYEPAYWFDAWTSRYFQALCLQKLGRNAEACAFFDAMELLARCPDMPATASDAMMDLVERGRFASDDKKDPLWKTVVKVETKAEE